MNARSWRVWLAVLLSTICTGQALSQDSAPSPNAGMPGTQAPVVLGTQPAGGESKVLGRRFPSPLQEIPPPEAPEVSVSIVSPTDSGFNRGGRSGSSNRSGGMGNGGRQRGTSGSGSQQLQQLGYQQ